jgi:hypothetical protein
MCGVGADAVKVTDSRSMVVGWTPRVLTPAILYNAIIDAEAGIDVRGI